MGVLKILANENKILAGGMQTTKKLHRTNAKLHKKRTLSLISDGAIRILLVSWQ
jgi:hypothetical protein